MIKICEQPFTGPSGFCRVAETTFTLSDCACVSGCVCVFAKTTVQMISEKFTMSQELQGIVWLWADVLEDKDEKEAQKENQGETWVCECVCVSKRKRERVCFELALKKKLTKQSKKNQKLPGNGRQRNVTVFQNTVIINNNWTLS